jgi:hypothetical protein
VIREGGETKLFTSVRKAADYIGIHHSYVAKSIDELKFYLGRGFIIHKADEYYSSPPGGR